MMEQGLLQQPQEQMPPEAPEEDIEINENDPALQEILKFVGAGLYERGAASKLAKAFGSAQDPSKAMADAAYDMIEIASEKTGTQVPHELAAFLAMTVLEEVVEVAKTGGAQISGAAAGKALKVMILRFAGEMGHDTRELQAAMDQVDPAMFDEAAQEGEQPEQAMPQQMPQGV